MNSIVGMNSSLLFAAAFIASAIGVALFRRWSLRRELFDIPNERSSHSTPTPRGGGLVIVLVCLVGYLVTGLMLDVDPSWGFLAGSLIVALVSWLDDLYSLPFWVRLIVHVFAAGLLIYDVGFWTDIFVPIVSVNLTLGNLVGPVVTAIWIVWFLNAYNFMDGIDGIAALQAIVSCAAWAVVSYSMGLPSVFLLAGIVTGASAGFLIHNWQPAKVFMGDVGSAFLGYTIAALPLLAGRESRGETSSILPVLAVLFVWLFVLDTVFTFTRRLLRGQRVWEAHREHVYQKLVIEGKSHSKVALLYGVAAGVLSLFVLLALLLSGIYALLAFLSFVLSTGLIIYLGIRKKG